MYIYVTYMYNVTDGPLWSFSNDLTPFKLTGAIFPNTIYVSRWKFNSAITLRYICSCRGYKH